MVNDNGLEHKMLNALSAERQPMRKILVLSNMEGGS